MCLINEVGMANAIINHRRKASGKMMLGGMINEAAKLFGLQKTSNIQLRLAFHQEVHKHADVSK